MALPVSASTAPGVGLTIQDALGRIPTLGESHHLAVYHLSRVMEF